MVTNERAGERAHRRFTVACRLRPGRHLGLRRAFTTSREHGRRRDPTSTIRSGARSGPPPTPTARARPLPRFEPIIYIMSTQLPMALLRVSGHIGAGPYPTSPPRPSCRQGVHRWRSPARRAGSSLVSGRARTTATPRRSRSGGSRSRRSARAGRRCTARQWWPAWSARSRHRSGTAPRIATR